MPTDNAWKIWPPEQIKRKIVCRCHQIWLKKSKEWKMYGWVSEILVEKSQNLKISGDGSISRPSSNLRQLCRPAGGAPATHLRQYHPGALTPGTKNPHHRPGGGAPAIVHFQNSPASGNLVKIISDKS